MRPEENDTVHSYRTETGQKISARIGLSAGQVSQYKSTNSDAAPGTKVQILTHMALPGGGGRIGLVQKYKF
jgi:hypothetical protein